MKNSVKDIKNYDIKTIYFNCFDTWLEIGDKTKSAWGLELFTALNLSAKTTRNMLLTQNKELREVLEEVAPYVFANPDKAAAIASAEAMIQEEIASIQLKPGAAMILPELQKRGYQIGLISNIAKAYIPTVLKLAPIPFDHMLFSCELGYKKTIHEERIYDDAWKRSNHKRKEIVMIGDHEVNDYDAAYKYGIHAIHMDRKRDNTKTNRVHTLEQLLDLFPDKKTQ